MIASNDAEISSRKNTARVFFLSTHVRRSNIQLIRRLFQVSVASSLLQLACPVRTRPPAAHFAHGRFFSRCHARATRDIYARPRRVTKASRAPAVKVKMVWNLKKAWYFGRLLITAAAVGVLGYLLLEDDTKIVESTLKIEDYTTVFSISPVCFQTFQKEGINFKTCLYNDDILNATDEKEVKSGKSFKCDDRVMTSIVDSSFGSMNKTTKFECCDRMQKSHTRLIVGASFLAAALLGSIIAVAAGLGDKNIGWHVIDRLIHAVVYIVATGLLGSALEFSQKNGVLTCNDSFENLAKNIPKEVAIYDTNEDHEEGFWMIVAALAISAVLALVESVIFIVETSHRGGFLVSKKTGEAAFGPQASEARVGSLFF